MDDSIELWPAVPLSMNSYVSKSGFVKLGKLMNMSLPCQAYCSMSQPHIYTNFLWTRIGMLTA
ncbi:hypothetical protein TorRG33x02_215650 [Trema orientale]|uniref:Uncharacterized protein n=1 Tax=Trema orientale TaxID=63057 RepID=A0A2P5EAT3_TREOI|nr:hypothetical protein TorRG33x02_215650 [Trema orientale]